MIVESKNIKHLSHATADARAIHGVDFTSCEIGGQVCQHVKGYEKVVARKNYLRHDIAFIAIVLQGLIGA